MVLTVVLQRCKNRFSRSGGFCYDSALDLDLSLGISQCKGCDLPKVEQLLRELPTLAFLFFFLCKLPQLYNMAFFGDHSRPSFGRLQETVADVPQWKTNFKFYFDILLKYMHGGPKSMIGIRILVWSDPWQFAVN
jgi:hypothetical protein